MIVGTVERKGQTETESSVLQTGTEDSNNVTFNKKEVSTCIPCLRAINLLNLRCEVVGFACDQCFCCEIVLKC